MPIKVILVSDHCLLLRGLEGVVDSMPQRFERVGSVTTYDALVQQIAHLVPDIVLLDIDGQPDHVLPVITTLKAVSDAKVLLLTRLDNPALQDQAVLMGARGVIDRGVTPEQLCVALQKVFEGQVWLDRVATGRIFVELSKGAAGRPQGASQSRFDMLTEREQEIVACMARYSGEPAKAIAGKMHISESTLRNHLTSIYEKLGVANRHGLVALAYRHGLAAERTH